MYRMILYSEAIWLAGGAPDLGVMNPANAVPGRRSSRPATATAVAASIVTRGRRKAGHCIARLSPRAARSLLYCGPLRAPRGIRATAWAVVAAGVAAPALRRRLKLPPPVVLDAGF